MSQNNSSSPMSVHDMFRSHLIGNIGLPVKQLVRHPRQRRFQRNHVLTLADDIHQTFRRASHPISVVLPVDMNALDEACLHWVNSAAQGTLIPDIPAALELFVIDGWHRTVAAQEYVDTFPDGAEIAVPVLQWPANVYKSDIFNVPELRTWQTAQNIENIQAPATFYEQLEALNDLKVSGASPEVSKSHMRSVFKGEDVAVAVAKLPYTSIWEAFFSYAATPLGETLTPTVARAIIPWDLGFDFLNRMFKDAVAQHNRILETYTDDKANFRLVHLIGNEDPGRFSPDKKAMSSIWKEVKVHFKPDVFKDWWDKIHNIKPRALYGEMARRFFSKKPGPGVSQLIPMYNDVMAKLLVLLYGGSFKGTFHGRGSKNLTPPWSAQMEISDDKMDDFEKLIDYIGENVELLVPVNQPENAQIWCQKVHAVFKAEPTNYEAMIWPGLTEMKGFVAWANLLDFADTIGFSRHQKLWETVHAKWDAVHDPADDRPHEKVAQRKPEMGSKRDSTLPRVGERSSNRIRDAPLREQGGRKPLQDRTRGGRGGTAGRGAVGKGNRARGGRGGTAGRGAVGEGNRARGSQRGRGQEMKGRGGITGLAAVRKKGVVDEDDYESEESGDGYPNESEEDREADGYSDDSDSDDHGDDRKGKESMDMEDDGFPMMGDDDEEPSLEDRHSSVDTTREGGDTNAMDVDTAHPHGRLAAGKRRAPQQLAPSPSRVKQARTSDKPSLSVNTSASYPPSSGLIETPARHPELKTTPTQEQQYEKDPSLRLIASAQKLQLMVLENASEESKRAVLQKVVEFTEQVMDIVERGDRPSPTTMQSAREGLESIRGSSVDTSI